MTLLPRGCVSTLPLSLHAWYEAIEEANFVGKAPDAWSLAGFVPEVYRQYAGDEPWELSLDALAFYREHPKLLQSSQTWLDPIQVIPLRDQFDLFLDWKQEKASRELDDASVSNEDRQTLVETFAKFRVEVSPDACLKLDESGLGAYEIAVPCLNVDAPLFSE